MHEAKRWLKPERTAEWFVDDATTMQAVEEAEEQIWAAAAQGMTASLYMPAFMHAATKGAIKFQ